jgi:putative hydrolase
MLEVDFHSHTFFSLCGIHTHIEMLTYAKYIGMKGLAITDHGAAQNSRFCPPFFDRLKDPVPGIRMLKGIEANLLDEKGTTDIPVQYIKNLDIILLGLHPHPDIAMEQTAEKYTAMLIEAIERNRCIDLITHPNEIDYPIDFEALALCAKNHGVALELNNSKILYNRTTDKKTMDLINACKKVGCRMAITSDAHALHEIGLDESALPYLKRTGFPDNLLVNNTGEKAFAFIEERKVNKR